MLPEGIFYNTMAEADYLSCVLQPDNVIEAENIISDLIPEEFYKESHKLIYSAVCEVVKAGELPNIATVYQRMKDNKTAEKAGGVAALTTLQGRLIGTITATQNKRIIKDHAARRALYSITAEIQKAITSSDKDAEELRAELAGKIEQVPAAMIEQDTESYLKSYAGSKIADFLATAEAAAKNSATKTGFSRLDKLLGGGLYAGLYVVGAISSLGKTTFCLQVADQVARAGRDVLIFSLEMAEDEIMAKSISRVSLRLAWSKYGRGSNNTARSTREVLTGALWKNFTIPQTEILFEACEDYEKTGQHIKIIEGVGNVGVNEVRAAVHRHIRITGRTPLVIVDYLQILAPYNDRGTDKQNTDKAVLELKKLSRDYNIPVIAISSFNRENYSSPVNLAAYKEAGSVEYSADVAIALQFAGMDFQEGDTKEKRPARIRDLFKDQIAKGARGDRQDIELKILKNRNGVKGEIVLGFYPRYNFFEEAPETTYVTAAADGWKAFGQEV